MTDALDQIDHIITAIDGGEYDSQLDIIINLARERKKTLASRKARELKPGDTVHFSSSIRPRYMVGLEAEVVQVNQKSVAVKCPMDPAYGKFSGSHNVRCPNELIQELV